MCYGLKLKKIWESIYPGLWLMEDLEMVPVQIYFSGSRKVK